MSFVLDYPGYDLETALRSVGPGWEGIIRGVYRMIDILRRDGLLLDNFSIAQVKEKFGGLRVYYDNGTDEVQEIIRTAEKASFETCERCGAPGVRRRSGWIKTLCDEHSGGKEPI